MPVCVLISWWTYAHELAKAIEINPSYAKAYYRRGLSYLAILRPTDAVKSFKSALKLDPGNTAIRSQLDATVKLVRRIEFEKVSILLCPFFHLPLSSPSFHSSPYPQYRLTHDFSQLTTGNLNRRNRISILKMYLSNIIRSMRPRRIILQVPLTINPIR
jgi:tetratricopeptide (TPR) repeat protein